MSNTRLEHALLYADNGWPVFPCHTAHDGVCSCRWRANCLKCAKHSHTRHGFNDATLDARQIKRWWAKWPDANVAIRTGQGSDLFALNVDDRHGDQDALGATVARLGLDGDD